MVSKFLFSSEARVASFKASSSSFLAASMAFMVVFADHKAAFATPQNSGCTTHVPATTKGATR